MSNTSTKRKHVTNACQPCRYSKIRCDGIRPTCGNCSKKEKECRFATKDDKRKVSLRTAIDILAERLAVLTETLMNHNVIIPAMNPQKETILDDICETLEISLPLIPKPDLPKPGRNFAATSETLAAGAPLDESVLPDNLCRSQLGPTNIYGLHQIDGNDQDCPSLPDSVPTDPSTADWPWHMFEPNAFFLSDSLNIDSFDDGFINILQNTNPVEIQSSTTVQRHGQVTNVSSDEEQDTDLIHQVSARFGALRIASDGQLRYYGAATNYHLLEGSRHDEEVDLFTTQQEVQDRMVQAGVSQEVPGEIEELLIELYFAWHNPTHLTVDRETFNAARSNKNRTALQAGYCSDVLVNAICAVGAAYETRYHPTFVTYPRSLAEFFASRAKILLDVELECPNIGTVQGLCLLSSHEAARGRDARTWLYGGMAMRLCFDLGLHINCVPYVTAGILTPTDVRARQTTFWSCSMINHLSSFHFGRPFRIDSEEITQPHLLSTNEVGQYGDMVVDIGSVSPNTDVKVLKEWSFLCETLSPLMRKLYGSSSIAVTTLQEVSQSVTQQLESWWTNLPPDLRIQTEHETRPEVLILHMGYHHFQILIHRPWTASKSQPWTGQGPGFRHARSVCSTSASEISKLLSQYEREYSFRRMHNYTVNVVFSAALISLFNVIAAKRGNNSTALQATSNLSVFFRALDDLSNSFDSARRAREHLATIQRKWYLAGTPSSSGNKRPVSSPPASGEKRLRSR